MEDLTAFLIAVGPLAILVTKTVDTIRNLVPDTVPKIVWNLAAFVIGLAYCLLFGVNLAGAIAFRPEVTERLGGTWGEVLTGLAVGAVAGFWHEHMDKTSAVAKEAKATVPTSLQS